ncbi:SMI1/KNR4 family protein [Chitinophaga lutea]|uniref:SMI1/KNR4 family protein n=1 Tax=Chitinophaga lutea TaxID=2488634 RepID=A0A3N4Q222_9BACT|nr:SMI1/KNR4 family protein [Chitinophaga lutea]RPE05824.1 SMI1/KNR4 family protein [Chitinophaga lutea]
MNCLTDFQNILKNNGIAANPPVDKYQITAFESQNNVKIPHDFGLYLTTMNGFREGEMWGLSNLWPLHRIIPLTRLASLKEALSTNIKDALEKSCLYDSSASAENKIVNPSNNWSLPNADSFFIFGDYNVNSCYWAIKLSNSRGGNNIICIYDWGNTYHTVAGSFSDFIGKIVTEGGESLI